ncbi:ABC transporter ATP-binding protein [Streptomyces gobiensis]|uniref:ABC transporter ATP-binding protein n=1 Tax=Streptomyces gobiensis TaxID=2875706 RepID=UPI001E588BE4|nr:ATP-binding cassette domain-containing protein [Streptomyces gobiensis]UGY92830.1 ATP-binding cassette domain-containing protein [Streptomyces gobiensis]
MPIRIADCWFAYGKQQVFSGLEMTVKPGVTVLLGPNGAGKSTLLSLAASVRAPQHGTIHLDRIPATHRSYRKLVAWMPQNITPMPGLTAREQVAYVGWAKGLSRREAWDKAADALDKVNLTPKRDQRTKTLSGGQLRRVGVASALVHDARILLLDEPTAGMDPTQRRAFRDLLAALDVSVLLSTHDVADLADDAQYVTCLYDGAIVHGGTTDEFLACAPPGTPSTRQAEAAYSRLCGGDA